MGSPVFRAWGSLIGQSILLSAGIAASCTAGAIGIQKIKHSAASNKLNNTQFYPNTFATLRPYAPPQRDIFKKIPQVK
jgi:hypothetical protein